ncbi:MAG: hypothetical protein IIZ63_14980 [Caulobacteraceae bacterium]|nr:hypothetical protein [Caulobacteraceae bacterium]
MTSASSKEREAVWPDLPCAAWADTRQTLHLWTQIVGKIRVAQAPWLNHSWQTTLHLTPRGLSTGNIPCGRRLFDVAFDFIDHQLILRADDGADRHVALRPRTTADFFGAVRRALSELDLDVRIDRTPNEIADAIPFDRDEVHAAYDPVHAERFWRVLLQVDRVFSLFRTGFLGKSSPSHFFWGSFDLAVTRFSGRRAPLHPGGAPGLPDAVAREAYSHEVSSAGFWPGGAGVDHPAFYAYAYPQPAGYAEAKVAPAEARYDPALGEFILPYDAVRLAPDPDAALLAFLESAHAAAASLGGWDRASLECALGRPRTPRPVSPP